jgi:hypothetical protein
MGRGACANASGRRGSVRDLVNRLIPKLFPALELRDKDRCAPSVPLAFSLPNRASRTKIECVCEYGTELPSRPKPSFALTWV